MYPSPHREDSSIEPPAFHPTHWPPPPPTTTPHPVPLSPSLSPSLRNALPQPKALRPHHPMHSDLSIASTRAEQEPNALRDLRRVTAPPSLMDPWQYDRSPPPPQTTRARFVKSLSSTSLVTDRLSDIRPPRRERWSMLTESARHRPRRKREWLVQLVARPNPLDHPTHTTNNTHPRTSTSHPHHALRKMHLVSEPARAVPLPLPLQISPLQGDTCRPFESGKDTPDSELSGLSVDSEQGGERLGGRNRLGGRQRAGSEGGLGRRGSFGLLQGKSLRLGRLFRRNSWRKGRRDTEADNDGDRRWSGRLSRFRAWDGRGARG